MVIGGRNCISPGAKKQEYDNKNTHPHLKIVPVQNETKKCYKSGNKQRQCRQGNPFSEQDTGNPRPNYNDQYQATQVKCSTLTLYHVILTTTFSRGNRITYWFMLAVA